jgi:biopolymer transport protein ExbD
MADINSTQSNKRKGSFAKVSIRKSTKVDLTPMVDLGFLLITFFVLTTSMTQPVAMNLMEPKEDTPQPVKKSGAMTIILGADHKIFYYYGLLDESKSEGLEQADFASIRALILHKKKSTYLGDLMYVIKADSSSSFGDNINLLDEMSICNVPAGHYAEVELTARENQLLKTISLQD